MKPGRKTLDRLGRCVQVRRANELDQGEAKWDHRTSRKPLRRALNSWPRLRWPAAIGAWLVISLVVLSGVVSAADPGSTHLRVTREVSGTVTVVNYNGSAFCLDTDVSSVQFCSEPYQRVGSAPLVVGEHVTGTVALLSNGPSSAMEVFILTDPQPTP